MIKAAEEKIAELRKKRPAPDAPEFIGTLESSLKDLVNGKISLKDFKELNPLFVSEFVERDGHHIDRNKRAKTCLDGISDFLNFHLGQKDPSGIQDTKVRDVLRKVWTNVMIISRPKGVDVPVS